MSDEQVKGIQRYDVVFRVDDEGRGFEGYRKVEDANGAYVLFKDHEQALAALEAEKAVLECALIISNQDESPERAVLSPVERTREAMLAARAALKGAS